LEVDYIVGYESETREFLNKIGPLLDDAILSVHFLNWQNTYCCIDFSEEVFLDFSTKVGSVKDVYHLYYDTVQQSIEADLGPYKPKRIAHPTLIHKFQLAHGQTIEDDQRVKEILKLMKEKNYELGV